MANGYYSKRFKRDRYQCFLSLCLLPSCAPVANLRKLSMNSKLPKEPSTTPATSVFSRIISFFGWTRNSKSAMNAKTSYQSRHLQEMQMDVLGRSASVVTLRGSSNNIDKSSVQPQQSWAQRKLKASNVTLTLTRD